MSEMYNVNKDTGEIMLSLDESEITVNPVETVSFDLFSPSESTLEYRPAATLVTTCAICGETIDFRAAHQCEKTIFERLVVLEREIELLKLENKQLRKEMKWL